MKLTITVGPPGSGKSTWAEDTAKKKGNTCLISRDDIRVAIFPGEYRFSKEKEELVQKIEENIVRNALEEGKNVIVHDTNLHENNIMYWKNIATEFNADFEEKFFEVSIVELLKRNHFRGKKALPISRLWHMYRKYKMLRGWKPAIKHANGDLPKCVIFDVDGTLVTIGDRSPYDFTNVIDDPANWHIVELFTMYQTCGYTCIVVSGRTGTSQCLKDTIASLAKYGVHPSAVFMRDETDKRHDIDVKEEILLTKILPSYYPVLAVDDRDTPTGMWRMNGIPCLQVNYGDF